MLSLVLISSLVSLVTLYLLLYRPNQDSNAKKKPSWFLGQKVNERMKKRQISTPPWLLWLLVCLFTIASIFLYYPKRHVMNSANTPSTNKTVLWVDKTFSSWLSLNSQPLQLESIAETVFKLSRNNELFYLKHNFLLNHYKIQLETDLIRVKNKSELIKLLQKDRDSPAWPSSVPFSPQAVKKVLSEKWGSQKFEFLALSDGQEKTLIHSLLLKQDFISAQLIPLKPAKENLKEKKVVEVIPKFMKKAWSNTPVELSDVDYEDLTEELENQIPQTARPQLLKTNFKFQNDFHTMFFSAQSQNEKQNLGKGKVIIVCDPLRPTFSEMDPSGDFKSFFHSQGNHLISKQCVEKNSNVSDRHDSETLKWHFRQGALWVVPLYEDILTRLFDDNQFWLPEGFSLEQDVLVYASALERWKGERIIENRELQGEKGITQFSLPVTLLPPLQEFKLEHHQRYSSSFSPFKNNDTDTRDIFWKAQNLPIYYVRTGLTSLNKELMRSAFWLKFWKELEVDKVKAEFVNLKKLTIDKFDDESIANLLSDNSSNEKLLSLSSLSPVTLKWNAIDSREQPLSFGFYKIRLSNASEHFLFLSPPEDESEERYFTPEQFAHLFHSEDSLSSDNRSTPSVLKNTFVGLDNVFYFLIALITWLLFLRLRHRQALLILCFLFLLKGKTPSFAQQGFQTFTSWPGNQVFGPKEPTPNIPFSVSWCGDRNEKIDQNYALLRNATFKRTTITLPEKLTMEACSPKASLWFVPASKELTHVQLQEHLYRGGLLVFEGDVSQSLENSLKKLETEKNGLKWESPNKKGFFYRSFYLLSTLDGCHDDKSQFLMMRKKLTHQLPFAVKVKSHFIGNGNDCFVGKEEMKIRSFINILMGLFSFDYKEEQMHMPEILKRVRQLGLEP